MAISEYQLILRELSSWRCYSFTIFSDTLVNSGWIDDRPVT